MRRNESRIAAINQMTLGIIATNWYKRSVKQAQKNTNPPNEKLKTM